MKKEEPKKPKNLWEAICISCGEQYDTPHKDDCIRARDKPNPDPRRKVLVKYEDVDMRE